MTDIEKPTEDPYNLIGSNWISYSESAYADAEKDAKSSATAAHDWAVKASAAAQQMPDDLTGQTGTTAEANYNSGNTALTTMQTNLTTVAGWMLDCSERVRTAKMTITAKVETGTAAIDKAVQQMRDGKNPDPDAAKLKKQYKDDIANIATTLKSDLENIGKGGIITPAYVRAPQSTPENPFATAQAVAKYTSGNTPKVDNPVHMPTMPMAVQNVENPTRTPIAPTPVASAPALPTPGIPASAPQASGLPVVGNIGNVASPQAPSAPQANTSAAQVPPSASKTDTPNTQPVEGIPLPGIPLPSGLIPSIAIPTEVASAGSAAPPVTPPPTSIPLGNGITPGVSLGAPGVATPSAVPLTPLTPLTPNAAQPIASAPAVPTTPPPTTSTPPPTTTTTTTPTPKPPVDTGTGGVWTQTVAHQSDSPTQGAEAAAAVGFVLPEEAPLLHKVLATLRDQYRSAGWNTPLAVARVHKGAESCIVWTTGDGLSLWVPGVTVPEGVYPLDSLVIPLHVGTFGSTDVATKLAHHLDGTDWETGFILTTTKNETPRGIPLVLTQYPDDAATILSDDEPLPLAVTRADAMTGWWDTADPMVAITRVTLGMAGAPKNFTDAALNLIRMRWSDEQPSGYLEALTEYHRADANDAIGDADMDELAYPAWQLGLLLDYLQSAKV